MNHKLKTALFRVIAALGLLLVCEKAFAHVKWFSGFEFLNESLPIRDVVGTTNCWGVEIPLFACLVVLSMLVGALVIFLDKKMELAPWNIKVNTWLDERKSYALRCPSFCLSPGRIVQF